MLLNTVELHARHIDHSEPEWDRFVHSIGGDLVQTTAWAMTKDADRHDCILVEATAGGAIVGGAMLVIRRTVGRMRIGYVAKGPVIAGRNPELAAMIVEESLRCARRHRLVGLVVQVPRFEVEAALERRGFRKGAPSVAPDASIAIDVNQPDDTLISAMSGWRRKDLKKTKREPIEIVESDDYRLFHQLHLTSAARAGYAPMSLDYLRKQWTALRAVDAATILVAKCDGEPAAAEWLTHFGGVVTTRLTGWNPAASGKCHVNVALQWEAIQFARRVGARTYDLGGFNRDAAKLVLANEGLPDSFRQTADLFKLDFGGRPVLYPRAQFRLVNRAANALGGPAIGRILEGRFGATVARKMRNV